MTAYGALWAGTSSPALTRLGSAVGMTAGANFSAVQPWGGMRRCNLLSNGIPLAWNNGSGGGCGYSDTGPNNVMVTIPQYCFYVDTTGTPPAVAYWIGQVGDSITLQNTSQYTLQTSDIHPAFIVDGGAKPWIAIGAYEAYNNSGVFQSWAGKTPTASLTVANARTYATANASGSANGWGLMTLQTLSAVLYLLLVEYASFNIASVFGVGAISGSVVQTTGGTISYGNTSYPGTSTTNNSYRGVEAITGNLSHYIEGANYKASSDLWVAPQSRVNTYAANTFTSPYVDSGYVWPGANYILSMHPDWMLFPATTGAGSITTYWCSLTRGPSVGNQVLVQFTSYSGGNYGLGYTMESPTDTSAYVGYRIQYLPG